MSDEGVKKSPKLRPSAGSALPPWLTTALHSRRTIKTWIRCCVALASVLILMVARKPSQTMGQAAFFCVIVSVMMPPTFALSVFIMAVTTLLLGMLLGWAWGNAAMASALNVRSASLFAQQQAKVQQSLVPNVPAALQIQVATFHGAFLDPRSSAVYGVFLFIGSFALGAARAYLPNLALLSIFGTIVLDIICTTGPLLPQSDYTLAKLFILPASFYIAVAIASLILVFPESQSHVWLTALTDSFWAPTLDLLRLQSEALESRPSDYENWADLNTRGQKLRQSLVNATEAVITQLRLIGLDTSIGRLGPSDLKKINAELKSIMFRAAGLHSFQTFVNDVNSAEQREAQEVEARLKRGDQTPRTVDRFRVLQLKIRERELQHGHDLDSLVPILAAASANLRKSSESSVECLIDWLQDCNSNRWRGVFSRPTQEQIDQRHQKLVTELQNLTNALDEFRNVERVKLIRPYERFFDPVTRTLLKNQDLFASKSLYICFVFIDTLDGFSESIAKLLKIIVDIDSQRPHAKLWFPGRIAKVTTDLKDNITNGQFKGTQGVLAMGSPDDPASFDPPNGGLASSGSGSTFNDDDDDDSQDGDSETAHNQAEAEKEREKEREKEMLTEPPVRRNPDAFPPTTGFGRSYVKLASILRFFKSAQGVFALRVAFVSVALWVPAVCPSSAWFYYDNKGVWALIMAQTALAVYAGDQIAGFIVRLTGTLIGLVVGMCVWYIGAGLGHGNPYGIVIATTAFLAPLFFVRLSGPPVQVGLWTMASVTVVLIVGYSWINANFNPFGNPGVGVTLGWKRALLVIIGFTAAFIVMLFPTPLSSRVLVRKTLAAVIAESGNIIGGEIEAFLAEEERVRNGIYDQTPELGKDRLSMKERRVRRISGRVMAVSTRLRYIRPSLGTAKFEPQLSGTWPAEEYERLFTLQTRVLLSLALLVTSFAKLDEKWCSALVHRTPFMNPNFLSDVFTTITILSNSLMNGNPLPAYLPKLRDRLVYHEYHAGRQAQLTPFLRSIGSIGSTQRMAASQSTESSSSDLNKGQNASTKGNEHDEEVLLRTAGPAHVDGSSMGIELDELTLDILLDEQLPAHSTAVIAFSSLISRIDEMVDIVSTLCGQATFRGYENLQRDYMDREERALGGGFVVVGTENRR